MIVKLLTEHHLEFLSLTGGCRGSSESTLVKMSNCWKFHAAAQISFFSVSSIGFAVYLGLPFLSFLKFILWVVFIDCIGVGVLIATFFW